MPSMPRVQRSRLADPARWRAMSFLNVTLRRSKNRQTTLGTKRSPWTLKRWSAISASVIRRSLDQDLCSMTLNPSRTPVSALRSRPTGTGASPRADQFDRCRRRHAEPAGGAPTAHALIFHGPNNAKAKVRRGGFSHAGWPPSPALRVNHDLNQKGIPSDSARSENALAP
jgi:hypothetical protein